MHGLWVIMETEMAKYYLQNIHGGRIQIVCKSTNKDTEVGSEFRSWSNKQETVGASHKKTTYVIFESWVVRHNLWKHEHFTR